MERQVLARFAVAGLCVDRIRRAGGVRGSGAGTGQQETHFDWWRDHAAMAKRRPGVVLCLRRQSSDHGGLHRARQRASPLDCRRVCFRLAPGRPRETAPATRPMTSRPMVSGSWSAFRPVNRPRRASPSSSTGEPACDADGPHCSSPLHVAVAPLGVVMRKQNTTEPVRISSPSFRRTVVETGEPQTKVPFLLPRSSSTTCFARDHDPRMAAGNCGRLDLDAISVATEQVFARLQGQPAAILDQPAKARRLWRRARFGHGHRSAERIAESV